MSDAVTQKKSAVNWDATLSQMPPHIRSMALAHQVNSQLLSSMKDWAVPAVGVGAGVAGAQGLYNLFRRNNQKPESLNDSLLVSVPSNREEEPKEGNWLTDRLQGTGATGLTDHPLANTAMMATIGGGLWGGHELVSGMLNSRRKKELAGDESDAQQQYETALNQLISPLNHGAALPALKMAADATPHYTNGVKEADDEELDQRLDALYARMKQADMLGSFLNKGLAIQAPLAALGALGAYNYTSSRQESKLLNKAIQRRQRQQLTQEPLYAFPEFSPQPAPEEQKATAAA